MFVIAVINLPGAPSTLHEKGSFVLQERPQAQSPQDKDAPAAIGDHSGGSPCLSDPLGPYHGPSHWSPGGGLPLTTKTIIFADSYHAALYRNHRSPTKTLVLVVEGRSSCGVHQV